MTEDTYTTLEGPSQGSYKEKGSRFLAFAYPVSSSEEAQDTLLALRRQYHDARHHCYAYRLGHDGSQYKLSDDGEPSGTAGKPIHGQLLSFNLTQVLVVVIRYFGGVKLGTGGLITAYKTAARDALEQAKLKTCIITSMMRIRYPFARTSEVMRILKEMEVRIGSSQYADDCLVEVEIRRRDLATLKSRLDLLYDVQVETVVE